MIKIKNTLKLKEENTAYINIKEIYLFEIKIYSRTVHSELPVDIVNCFPENQQNKIGMGFKK